MSFLVIKLFVLFLAVTCQGQTPKKCWGKREDKRAMQLAIKETRCTSGPFRTVIQLPVPEGYDKVYPSATVAMRCTGLACLRSDQECTAANKTTRTMKVEAYNINDGMNKKCVEVTIEEHHSCHCICEISQEDCRYNKVFNRKMCRCDCPPKASSDCMLRMKEMKGMVMWDEQSCACPCNNRRVCGNGETWDYGNCKCVVSNEIDTDS